MKDMKLTFQNSYLKPLNQILCLIFFGLISVGCGLQLPQETIEEVIPEDSFGVFFVKTSNNPKDASLKLVFRPIEESIDPKDGAKPEKLKQAINSLLAGPSEEEVEEGFGTEIPEGTKLLQFKNTPERIILNLSDQFSSGGGSRSMILRYQQLEKTIQQNSENKAVFVELEGKPLKVVGGEGLVTDDPIYKGKESSTSDKDKPSII